MNDQSEGSNSTRTMASIPLVTSTMENKHKSEKDKTFSPQPMK